MIKVKRTRMLPLLLTAALFIASVAVTAANRGEKRRSAAPTLATADEARRYTAPDDMRGVWVTYMDLNMQYESDRSETAFRRKIETIAADSKAFGFNTLVVQVRPFCDALYPSGLFPYSHILSGAQGEDPGYDALRIICDVCGKNGLQIHAWINPYRVIANGVPEKLSSDNPAVKDEGMLLRVGEDVILNPADEKARRLIADGVLEIAENYPVDGIQFDDYFYPPDTGDQDSRQYEEYADSMPQGKAMDVQTWRSFNVDLLLSETYLRLHRRCPGVAFGISPQGNLGNNASLNADVVNWCAKKGFLDYICPQLYFSLDNPALGFEQALSEWTALDYADGIRLYAGLGAYKAGSDADEGTWLEDNDILAREYNILEKNKKANGFMLYSYASLHDEKAQKELENFRVLVVS